jgi:GT2 family glycosyltransferase/glycosyltransferase involved in cell wall biosynthesis
MMRQGQPVTFSIDIVIPVYNAADDVRRCVESVLAHNHDDCRITLIDDGSTDPRIALLFAELERRHLPELLLLRHDDNRGFIATANRGIANSSVDVVLLNSDTRVTSDWLGAIRRCAASDATIGTITPFSNNAEICSFPLLCVDNPVGGQDESETIAAAMSRAAAPTYPDLPTGVGFCLFIRRALIDEIGLFDTAFGAGYGEENDLCLRAARSGWRNVLADDAFVVHVGGRSFAGQKVELSPRNTAILLERHPHYTAMVEDYIRNDPLAPLREAARSELLRLTSDARGVLHVIHDHGGGTETHVRALIDATRDRWRHYLAIAVGDEWQIEEHRADGSVATFAFGRRSDESWREFMGATCATFAIALIHLHNISGCREALLAALEEGIVPYGYTVHDLNFACPTITFLGTDQMFCGAITDAAVCARCLAAQPDYAAVDIESWRERHRRLLERAAFVIAPSRWAARMLERYFPGRSVRLIVHGTSNDFRIDADPSAPALTLPDDGAATIALLGAIGPDKGARRIERLVALARQRNLPLRFVLIGYLDVQHTPWQSDDARFSVHGRYDRHALPALLAHYRVRLVIYPSAGPETFSYTLSESWAAGVPVFVPPIGALAERVEGSGAGWVMTEAQWRDERLMLDRMAMLVDDANRAELEAARARAMSMPHASLAEMADATFAVYEEALAGPTERMAFKPFARARIRDALGYRAWTPPVAQTDITTSAPVPLSARVAHAALAIRHTLLGRTLYRVTPQPVLNALKARLKT